MTNPDQDKFPPLRPLPSDAYAPLVTDEEIECAGDEHEPTNVSAPSKAMHHCVND